jgi:hypothetical protein
VGGAFFFPVDRSACAAFISPHLQLFSLRDYLCICGRQHFASPLETDADSSAMNSGVIISHCGFLSYEIRIQACMPVNVFVIIVV